MYTLYWSKGGANMACHAALIEIGAPYKLIEIDTAKAEQKSAAYLALNPNGRVPTLIAGGRVMYESAAILLFLSENHPVAGLMPPVGSPGRAHFLQWLFYLTNTLQEALMQWWHSDSYLEDEAERKSLVASAERRLAAMWQLLDGVLAKDGPYLLGREFSAVDIFLVMLTRWSRNTAKPARLYPNIGHLVELVEARPAYRRMMAEEGIG
jgi:glutathione S-transferase